ncbi:TonB-dependent receptor [Aureitalea marina]|uniref:TonB-dependent receptor n=1 Tax=Aureitalea marina TaxID=930804 RepID=A0A2S7KQZ4_9FLAO|nr:TonB-dependent receptor [Aureitalea marina]PQB05046.1 TonB-dependent receptor [Aureitalea marina]
MKNFIWATLLLLTGTLSAQSIRVQGVITDSIGAPLELANVIATVKESGDIESYGITNSDGKYQLDLGKGNTYVLKASFLGYETLEEEVTVPADGENITKNFTLKSQASSLDAVEIVYEMPVTVEGDTITYNADSFNRGDERKLGDVLQNLPGVEVNDDGEIEVEGKTVSKVMVEGKDFFDGDSKLATKNIPSDAVDKVQVLRNYSEVSQLSGVTNNQDNIAINIKLKEGKKNFWFGEVTAGAGVDSDSDGRYLVKPKLFYYSPKYSINIITDFNDIGDVPFTFRDYFNFTGGFRNFNSGGGTRFNISQSDLGFAVQQNNRANAIESNFIAGNFSWNVSNAWDASGFAILSDNKTNFVTNSLRQFISSGTVEATESNTDQRNQLGMLKLSTVYKPGPDFQLDYDALIKGSNQTEDNSTLSQFENNTNDIVQEKDNEPFSVNQNINAYYTLDEKNIFAGQVQHLYQDENPFYKAVTDLQPFPGILPVDMMVDRFDVNQQKNIQTNKIDAKVDWFYVVNNLSNFTFTGGVTYSNQQFDSNIFQLLDNGGRLDLEETDPIDGETQPLANDVRYRFTDLFLGARYKFKAGKFIVTPGLTLHNYNVANDQLGIDTSQNDWWLLPDFNTVFEIKQSENIRFNYAMVASYTDVNNFAEAYVFNNYNSLFRGNRFLENSISHELRLNYFSFNLFNNTSISAALNYTKRIEGVKQNGVIVSINQVQRPENISSNFPDETFTAFGNFSKRIKKMRFSLSANLSLSESYNIVNQRIQRSDNFGQNYRFSARSSFREWPNFEVGYRVNINQYDNGGFTQTFYTQQPFFNVDVNFLKNFTLSAQWDFYDYTNDNNTVENDYSFLDATLYYQKGDSPWEFSVQATNLLDTEFLNNDSTNDQFFTTNQFFVLPRIVMFVARYEL